MSRVTKITSSTVSVSERYQPSCDGGGGADNEELEKQKERRGKLERIKADFDWRTSRKQQVDKRPMLSTNRVDAYVMFDNTESDGMAFEQLAIGATARRRVRSPIHRSR